VGYGAYVRGQKGASAFHVRLDEARVRALLTEKVPGELADWIFAVLRTEAERVLRRT
jgi:hypothetical protein